MCSCLPCRLGIGHFAGDRMTINALLVIIRTCAELLTGDGINFDAWDKARRAITKAVPLPESEPTVPDEVETWKAKATQAMLDLMSPSADVRIEGRQAALSLLARQETPADAPV